MLYLVIGNWINIFIESVNLIADEKKITYKLKEIKKAS